MSRRPGREKAEQLGNGVRELHSKESENGNHDIEKNPADELAVPIQFAGLGAIEVAEQGVAVHLYGHEQSHGDEGENNDPTEQHDKLMWLKRIGTYGHQQKQETCERESGEIGHLREYVREKQDGAPDKELFGSLDQLAILFFVIVIGRGSRTIGAPDAAQSVFDLARDASEGALRV